MAHKIKLGIIISFFSIFLMSENIHATSNIIDFTTTPGFGAYGFCANNRQWEYGSLKYSGYSWNVSSHITKTFTTGNYNQIAFNTIGCSNTPWGVHMIGLNVRSAWGLTDGKYINIDLVSNNSGFPFFNGSVVYGYEVGTGAVIPGYIDKRTYDVKMQKNSTTWLSGRDQVGSEYSMQYDEIEIIQGQPTYLHHLQFSIPYHASEFTSNGVSNLQIATSQWLVEAGNNGSHFQEFGSVQSPLFYLDSSSVSPSTSMFWLYVSVSDEAEFTSEDSWVDSSEQFYNNNYDAVDNIAGLGLNDINAGDSSGATNLIGQIGSFFDQIKNVQADNTCSVPANFGHLNLGNISLCTGKENMSWVVTFGAYAFQIIWVVGISLLIIRQLLDVLDWGRNG